MITQPASGFFTFETSLNQTITGITVMGGGGIEGIQQVRVGRGPEIPEPATMILLGTGLAGLAAKVRKRRKA